MTPAMDVPFFRPSIGECETAAVLDCLGSGWLTTGPRVAEFERLFAAKMGEGSEAIAVNSATAGLHLALEACGIGPGDEVIVPTLTFTATAEVVRYLGATPVFVDVGAATFCLDLDAVAAAVTSRTKAIIPVHFAGRPCEMTTVWDLARRHGFAVIEDAAHALPTYHKGELIGAGESDAVVFSFYANKTMTTGEGGMLVTRNPELAARARTMRLHGIDRDVFDRFTSKAASWVYDVVAAGFKYNMTDIAAAIGIVQLSRLEEFVDARAERAARYTKDLLELPVVLPPDAAEGDKHAWHLYVLQLTEAAKIDRAALIDGLRVRGVGCSVHYRPLHQMTFWSDYSKGSSFPNADRYFEGCVSIPLFMDMTDAEQAHVTSVLHDLLS